MTTVLNNHWPFVQSWKLEGVSRALRDRLTLSDWAELKLPIPSLHVHPNAQVVKHQLWLSRGTILP